MADDWEPLIQEPGSSEFELENQASDIQLEIFEPSSTSGWQQVRKYSKIFVVSSSLLLAFMLLSIIVLYNQSKHQPLLILISIDGTRPEYLNRGITPTLSKMGKHI